MPATVEGRAGMAGAERRAALLAVGVLCIVSILAFANTFQNDFAYDDKVFILKNRLIKELRQLPVLFTRGYGPGIREDYERPHPQGGTYRPLVLVTFAMNHALGGFRPFGYHLVNLLLHIGASVALYALARRLGLSWAGALAASTLFAVHPIHTEAVTGIVGRAELLMALGVLLALLWYPAPDGGARGRAPLLASLAAFAAALLSKEQAMVLPALFVLYEFSVWTGREPWRALILGTLRRSAGYLLVLGVYIALRAAVLGTALYKASEKISLLDNPLAHASWDQRLLTALKVAGKYLWLYAWPAELSADYSYNAIPLATSPFEPAVLAALLAWGSLLALAVYAYVRGARPVAFAIGFTALTFLPTSNFLVVIGTVMGERLFYLPSVGLSLLAGAAWDRVAAPASRPGLSRALKWAGLAVCAAILALLSVRTIARNRDWRDTETLMRSAVRVVPASAKVRVGLGTVLKDPNEALRELQEAIRVYPQYLARHASINAVLGTVLLKAGRTAEAIEVLERAARLNPTYDGVHHNLGSGYAKQGRWREAEAAYRRALALAPEDAATHSGLGAVLLETARVEQGVEFLKRAVDLDPTHRPAHHNLGSGYTKQGRWREAEAAYRRALALGPNHAHTYSSLSVALRMQGRHAEALAAADAAIQLNPAFVDAYMNRALALEVLGRAEEAAAAYERVLALRPDLLAAKKQLDRLRRILSR